MRNINCNILSADDDTSQTGSKVDSNQLVSASFSVVFGDGTANGTIKIQASNDPFNARYNAVNNFTPTNWVDIPSMSATITSGSPAIISIPNMAYRWVRAVWTRTSGGSTTINVNMDALSA